MSAQRRSARVVWALALVATTALTTLAACPEAELDETFPCRAPEDCVEGFACHPERWICVPEGELDGGAADTT